MVAVWVKTDGPVEELLIGVMNLDVILWRHHVVIRLPVFYLGQVLLDLNHFLDRFPHIFNDPTLVQSSLVRGYQDIWICWKRCILYLADNSWILRLLGECYVLALYFDRLIKILLVECVILFIIFGVSHRETVVPCSIVQLRPLLIRCTSTQPRPWANRVFLESDSVL